MNQPPSGTGKPVNPATILALTLLMNIFYTLDRTIPTIIAEDIKTEFALSDSELGLYTGLAFGVSFAIAGFLSGPLVDRFNRTRLLAGMLGIWSALTALAGATSSFWQLLTLRFAVGAAEAGGSPAAMSILTDTFRPERRGSAIGVYKVGGPLGYAAASVIGGFVTAHYGWRVAVLVAGIPGILLAVATWRLIPDLPRGRFDDPSLHKAEPAKLGEIVRVMVRSPGIGLITLGLMSYAFANLGLQAFLMPFLLRVHGMSLPEASSWFALAAMMGGVTPLVLGVMNDWLVRKGQQRSAYLAAGATIISSLAALLMLATDSTQIAIVGLIIWQMIALAIASVNYAAVLTLSPPSMRGTIIALLLSGTYLIGMGIAPVFVGVLSDLLGGGKAIRGAGMIILSVNLVAILMYTLAGLQIARRR